VCVCVCVSAVPDPGLSSAALGGIYAGVAVILLAAVAGIYYLYRSKQTGKCYIQLILENINKIFIVQNNV